MLIFYQIENKLATSADHELGTAQPHLFETFSYSFVLGYLVSCMSPTIELTLVLGPTLIIPLMLLGGLFVNAGTIPASMEWLKYFSWFMFGNEALLINQWEGVTDIQYPCQAGTGGQYPCQAGTGGLAANCTITGEDVLAKMHFSAVGSSHCFLFLLLIIHIFQDNFMFDIYMLIIQGVGYRVLAFCFLALKTRRKG